MARLLTLLPGPRLALIKMRSGRPAAAVMPAQNADEVLRWMDGRVAARRCVSQQMHGVFVRSAQSSSHRRFHLNRNLFDKNIRRPERLDREVKRKESEALSLQVVALTGPPVNLRGKVNSSICVSQGGSVLLPSPFWVKTQGCRKILPGGCVMQNPSPEIRLVHGCMKLHLLLCHVHPGCC